MRAVPRVSSLLLLVGGALLGWLGHGVLSSLSCAVCSPAAFAERDESGAAGIAGDPSGPAAEGGSLLADWYDSSFAFASRVHDLEALVQELQARDPGARALLATAIQRAPERELLGIVGTITHLDADSIGQLHDVRRFSQRLAEVAWDEAPEVAPSDEAAQAVAFSRIPNPDDLEEGSGAVFSRNADRIYAAISLDGYEGDRVMVKWFNRDSLKIETLRSFRYGREDRGVWAFVSRPAGWTPGRYQVNVYTQDDEMRLIGQGGYSVE